MWDNFQKLETSARADHDQPSSPRPGPLFSTCTLIINICLHGSACVCILHRCFCTTHTHLLLCSQNSRLACPSSGARMPSWPRPPASPVAPTDWSFPRKISRKQAGKSGRGRGEVLVWLLFKSFLCSLSLFFPCLLHESGKHRRNVWKMCAL